MEMLFVYTRSEVLKIAIEKLKVLGLDDEGAWNWLFEPNYMLLNNIPIVMIHKDPNCSNTGGKFVLSHIISLIQDKKAGVI